MLRPLLLLLLVGATAAQAAEPVLDDSLCNFAIEGLTVKSTPAEVRAVFAARGRVDESRPPMRMMNRKMTELIIFRSSPSSSSPRPTGLFQLQIEDGRGQGIRFYSDLPGADGRVRDICARVAGRFQTSNCEPRRTTPTGWGIIVQPPARPMDHYCQLTVTAGPDPQYSRIDIGLGLHPGVPAQLGTTSPVR